MEAPKHVEVHQQTDSVTFAQLLAASMLGSQAKTMTGYCIREEDSSGADNTGSGYWILLGVFWGLICRKELQLVTLQNLFADAQVCVCCLNVRK